MKKPKKGKIDISELNAPPEKHEYETARYFVDRGLDVVFLKPSNVKGMNSPDFEMAGRVWETKSPVSDNLNSIKRRLIQATKQSEHVIFDLRRMNTKSESKIIKIIKKGCESSKMKTMLVIVKDGRLLTLKGRFVIMKTR